MLEAMTDKGLMVIVNNHNSKSGWCCHYSQELHNTSVHEHYFQDKRAFDQLSHCLRLALLTHECARCVTILLLLRGVDESLHRLRQTGGPAARTRASGTSPSTPRTLSRRQCVDRVERIPAVAVAST